MPKQGTQGDDKLYDTSGNDKLIGHQGDDIFYLSTGRDTVNGQGGFDTAVFQGRFQTYLIDAEKTGNLRTTVTGATETAELKWVEKLVFDNGSYDVASGVFTETRVALLPNNTPVQEGGTLKFDFVRTGDLSQELTVYFTHAKNPTQPQFGEVTDSDLISPYPASITFAPGQDHYTLSLPTLNDTLVEGFESVRLTIQQDSHYAIGIAGTGPGFAVSGIVDNDLPPPPPLPPVVSITPDQPYSQVPGGPGPDYRVTVAEGDDIVFSFTRAANPNSSGPVDTSQPLTIHFLLADGFFGGSVYGEDFVLDGYTGPALTETFGPLPNSTIGHTGWAGVLVIPAGQTSASLEVDILTDDPSGGDAMEQGFFVNLLPDQVGFDYQTSPTFNHVGVNVLDA